MQVKYGLPGAGVAIHNNPVAALGNTLLARDLFCGQKQLAYLLRIAFVQRINCRDVLARNYEDMGRSLRIDVTKSDRGVRFVDDICRNFTGKNSAKQAVFRAHHRL